MNQRRKNRLMDRASQIAVIVIIIPLQIYKLYGALRAEQGYIITGIVVCGIGLIVSLIMLQIMMRIANSKQMELYGNDGHTFRKEKRQILKKMFIVQAIIITLSFIIPVLKI